MKKNIRLTGVLLVFVGVLGFTPSSALAGVDITFYVQGPDGSILANNVALEVPESCTLIDSAGASIESSGHKVLCALKKAGDQNIIDSYQVTDKGWGVSLDSINGIENTSDWSELWQLWLNGSTADIGIQGLELSSGDAFQLTYGPWKTEIIQGIKAEEFAGGPVIVDVYPREMDVEAAMSFLVERQAADGSFGSVMVSDWAAVAFGAYNGKSATALAAKNRLVEWLAKHPVAAGSPLTDFERRAMALMSLGVNPYTGTGQNVIGHIISRFDGGQFGEENLVNDDIFALLALENAGYERNVTPLLETLPFLLSWQGDTGSFGSVDLTAAAIQALSVFPESTERDAAMAMAREYLSSQQKSSGGFGNVYSTAWVLQAIAALNEDGDSWAMDIDKRTPEHFIALRQALDGGLLKEDAPENRIWATSYAIPAVQGKTWGDVLQNFEKPAAPQPQPQPQEPRGEDDLTPEEEAALQTQIEALEQEIALAAVKLQELERIEQEVSRIAKEVEQLRPQVLALHNQYLASLEQEEQQQDTGLAQAPEQEQEEELPVLNKEEPAQQEGETVLSVETQEDEDEQFAAAAAGGADGQNFFATAVGQIVLVVATGVVVFLFLGGTRLVGQYFPRPRITRQS